MPHDRRLHMASRLWLGLPASLAGDTGAAGPQLREVPLLPLSACTPEEASDLVPKSPCTRLLGGFERRTLSLEGQVALLRSVLLSMPLATPVATPLPTPRKLVTPRAIAAEAAGTSFMRASPRSGAAPPGNAAAMEDASIDAHRCNATPQTQQRALSALGADFNPQSLSPESQLAVLAAITAYALEEATLKLTARSHGNEEEELSMDIPPTQAAKKVERVQDLVQRAASEVGKLTRAFENLQQKQRQHQQAGAVISLGGAVSLV
ncbi:hypothetical protein CYMTET_34387, partial [Cymbomonas tetramitiformis]